MARSEPPTSDPADDRRVLIVDEDLRDWRGHTANFVSGMAQHLLARGAIVEVWGHHTAQPDLVPEGAVLRRVFRQRWMDLVHRGGAWTRLSLVLRQNAALATALLARFGRRPPSLIISTNVNIYHLLAWWVWLLVAPRRTRVVLMIFRQPWLMASDGRRWRLGRGAGLFRWVLRGLGGAVRAGRCTLAMETRHTALLIAKIGGVRGVIVPVPQPPGRSDAADRVRGEVLRLGYLGVASAEKGFGELLEVIERFAAREGASRRVRFVLHRVHGPGARPEWSTRVAAIAQEHPWLVELIPEDLPVAAFSAVEASLDGLLLPYWKHEYTGRGSSLTSDAVCLGVPVIYTQGTWIAETIRRFGAGVGCRDRDAASLEAAIEAFVRDHAALAAQARKRAVAARREYSWATFFERVPAGGLPWERRIADDESRERPEARSPARARPGECEHPAPRQATAAQRANSDRVSRTAPRTEGVMKTPQRFLVVEECLVDERGHYAAFVGGLAAWLAARGDEVEVWAHAAVASRVIPAGVGFQAAFRENWIEALFRRTRSRRTLLLLTHNLAFFRALRRAGKGRSWDCVVATDANIFHLLAWRVWLALAPRRTRLALVTIRAPWLCDYGAGGEMIFKRQAWLYRRAWRLFAGEIRTGRCRLATDTEANSAALGAFAGVPFVPVPLPRPDSLLERLGRPPPTEGGVRLGFIGRPTREKGFDRFLAAMAECVGGGLAEPLCFVVQWQEAPDVNTADREKLRELAARAPQRVKVVEGVLSEADYAALLGSLHAIVLPYVHSAYAGRGSSLAMDSLCAGRPLICTAGTWGAERMRACGAGIECGEDVASLVAAFARFAGEHGALTAAAQARMSLARDYFSWSRLMRQLDIDQPTAHRGGGRT